MAVKYKLVKNPMTNKVDVVLKTEDGSKVKFYIPFSTNNSNYNDYLAWVAKGNTAEAAD